MESRSRRRHRIGMAPFLAGTTVIACSTTQLYPGPPRAIEELVVIETRSPNKISMIDGQATNIRKAEILPGSHSLEFSGEFGELLATAGVVVGERQSRPLLKTRCALDVRSMEAGRYTFSANAEIDQRSSGPDSTYRWHKTSVDPSLLDADGNAIAGLTCDQTCRLQGRKNQSNVSRACEFED